MTDFIKLAEALDSISSTRKRTEKVAIATEFLRKVDIDEISKAALFLSGKVFAESDQRTLNISWKGLLNALKKVVDVDDQALSKVYEGDTGEAVAKVLESTKESRQSTLFSEVLSIASVSQTLERIADAQGKGSVKEKQTLLTGLFMDA